MKVKKECFKNCLTKWSK